MYMAWYGASYGQKVKKDGADKLVRISPPYCDCPGLRLLWHGDPRNSDTRSTDGATRPEERHLLPSYMQRTPFTDRRNISALNTFILPNPQAWCNPSVFHSKRDESWVYHICLHYRRQTLFEYKPQISPKILTLQSAHAFPVQTLFGWYEFTIFPMIFPTR